VLYQGFHTLTEEIHVKGPLEYKRTSNSQTTTFGVSHMKSGRVNSLGPKECKVLPRLMQFSLFTSSYLGPVVKGTFFCTLRNVDRILRMVGAVAF